MSWRTRSQVVKHTLSRVVSTSSPRVGLYCTFTAAAPRLNSVLTVSEHLASSQKPARRHADAFSLAFPIGHRLDRPMRHWTSLLRTYKLRCRLSKNLSTHSAVTWADAACLTVLSRRLSHRSVIFFKNLRMTVRSDTPSAACVPRRGRCF